MFEITADDVGRHDFLFAPCSHEMFQIQYGAAERGPNCVDNLVTALSDYHVPPDRVRMPFNVFMNVGIGKDGELEILPPLSRTGDSLTLRAEMDLVVGIAACSAPRCNADSFGPIDIEIR